MKRLLFALVAISATAQPAYNCGDELERRWNRFATDANAYVQGLSKGLVDARIRKRLDSEWQSVRNRECF